MSISSVYYHFNMNSEAIADYFLLLIYKFSNFVYVLNVFLYDSTWRKFCTVADPALAPGTVKGGDSGGMSLGCFGGVDTMKNTFVAL